MLQNNDSIPSYDYCYINFISQVFNHKKGQTCKCIFVEVLTQVKNCVDLEINLAAKCSLMLAASPVQNLPPSLVCVKFLASSWQLPTFCVSILFHFAALGIR